MASEAQETGAHLISPQSNVNTGHGTGFHCYAHRVSRGTNGKDTVSRLERIAAANHRRIRKMKERVRSKDARQALETTRLRLLEVLLLLSERPEKVDTETRWIIDSTMSTARDIYANASKLDDGRRIARKGKRRTAEGKDRFQNQHVDCADETEEVATLPAFRGRDLIAEAFQDGLENNETGLYN